MKLNELKNLNQTKYKDIYVGLGETKFNFSALLETNKMHLTAKNVDFAQYIPITLIATQADLLPFIDNCSLK